MPNCFDLTTIQRAKSGDPQALAEVVSYLQPIVYSHANHLANGIPLLQQEAKDVAQNTLVAIIEGLGSLRSNSSVEAWARRILKNKWSDLARHNLREPNSSVIDKRWALNTYGAIESPDKAAEHTEESDIVKDVISDLSGIDRRIAKLLYQGSSPQEIAKLTDCNPKTTYSRVQKVRGDLAHALFLRDNSCLQECIEEAGRFQRQFHYKASSSRFRIILAALNKHRNPTTEIMRLRMTCSGHLGFAYLCLSGQSLSTKGVAITGRGASIARRLEDFHEEISDLQIMANIYSDQEDFAEALALCEQSFRFEDLAKSNPGVHYLLAGAYRTYASALVSLSQMNGHRPPLKLCCVPPQALQFFDRSCQILERVGGKCDVGSTTMRLAEAYIAYGQYDPAYLLLAEADKLIPTSIHIVRSSLAYIWTKFFCAIGDFDKA